LGNQEEMVQNETVPKAKRIRIQTECLKVLNAEITTINIQASISLTEKDLNQIEEIVDTSFEGFIELKARRLRKQISFIKSRKDQVESLTKREVQVLKCLAKGMNNPEIADLLFISRRTVEEHRKHINKKLGIKNSMQLWKIASAFELI
tara:strand:+ start:12629 stop:13075 length:447 start_codon:yes stop_codon:yes gene_type:complete